MKTNMFLFSGSGPSKGLFPAQRRSPTAPIRRKASLGIVIALCSVEPPLAQRLPLSRHLQEPNCLTDRRHRRRHRVLLPRRQSRPARPRRVRRNNRRAPSADHRSDRGYELLRSERHHAALLRDRRPARDGNSKINEGGIQGALYLKIDKLLGARRPRDWPLDRLAQELAGTSFPTSTD